MDITISDEIKRNAVKVKHVYYAYRNRVKVIKNLSLNIPEGEIFALLGENGCGKTTLLKMMLGRLKPEFGSIRVFGGDPQSRSSDIPGPGVGYMPQELALFNEFTIEEMLIYFANIFHMSSVVLKARTKQLLQLLNLPEKDRRVGQLSGGQKRLVSIAVTIVHKPKLIILDEPTVGVDSILRCRIWLYFEDLCRQYGNTVLITTHYIEEAKRAKTVAFMKSGSILKQSNPLMLLETYRCSTLEAVYLYLWKENDKLLANRRRSTQADIGSDAPQDVDLYSDGRRRLSQIKYMKKTIDFKRIYALIWKFYVRTKRFPLFLILFNLIPLIALTAMRLSIGQLPYNVPVSVYNGETEPRLSKLYLDLVNKKYIKINEYESRELAIDSIVRGKGIFGIIFEKNFSKTLELRFQTPFRFKMTKQELNSSTVTLYADFSETVTGLYAVHYLGEAFLKFGKDVAISLNLNPGFFSIPFNMEAVYGVNFITDNHIEKVNSFAELLLPAALVIIFHLTSMAYSAFLIIYDRKESHLDRFFVAGGQPIEVLISHYAHHLILVSVQVLLSLCCAFSLFDITHVGSYVEVFAMCVLQGLQGMSIGLFISLIFYDEISVAVVASALMFPIWIMSGVFWPLEAIPPYFRPIADWTPLTKPIDTVRSIMRRGWTYHNPDIRLGYFVSFSYTSVLTISSVLLFHTFSFNSFSFNHFLF